MRRYWQKVKQMSQALKGDGCTNSPDLFYTHCCDEHDIHYRTGHTLEGTPISRKDADRRLFTCMKKAGKTPIIGRFLVPCIYWAAVRLFGGRAWRGDVCES